MKVIDLFCGAGGASKGLKDAGFEYVTGVDFADGLWETVRTDNFIKKDVFKLPKSLFAGYDFIWASPPCQAYSIGTKGFRNKGKEYPDLIERTRELLLKTGKPFVIENVPGSPLRKDLMLCGEMFDLPIIRHRWFEVHGFECEQPEHKKHLRKVTDGTAVACWTGGKPGCFGDKVKRAKLRPASVKEIQSAMGIDWIEDKKVLCQCVPPAYSEYIGSQFLGEAVSE